MYAIRYRREQGGMATLSEKSNQEASEGRGDEYNSTDIGKEQTRCSVCHRNDAVQAYTTAHQPR